MQTTVSLPERYRVTRRIASGGMATVYACEDQVLGRLVAVKVLAPQYAADEEAVARFQREARAVAKVSDHPNVVTIYDIGEHDDAAFIVMEYFPGGTVADRLRAEEPIPRPTAVRWLEETASALDHAHGAGIVHRDVKPANLLLDGNGRLAVADFGIARMATDVNVTSTGMVLGTAASLSPEQVTGEEVTGPSDIYSLGLVLLEAVTGVREYQGIPTEAALARLHRPPAVPETLPPAWQRLLAAMTATEPAERPDADAVAHALRDQPTGPVPVAAARTADPTYAPILARQPGAAQSGTTVPLTQPVVATQVVPTTPPSSDGPQTAPIDRLGDAIARGVHNGVTRLSNLDRQQRGALVAIALLVVFLVLAGVLSTTGSDGPDIPENTPTELQSPLRDLHEAVEGDG